MRLMPAIILAVSATSIGTAQAQYYQPTPPAYQVQPPNTPPPGNFMSPFGGYGSNPTNPGNQLQRPSRSYDSDEGHLGYGDGD